MNDLAHDYIDIATPKSRLMMLTNFDFYLGTPIQTKQASKPFNYSCPESSASVAVLLR
jgi:hypothetical protein